MKPVNHDRDITALLLIDPYKDVRSMRSIVATVPATTRPGSSLSVVNEGPLIPTASFC
jgi:hypothetical protein